ncbi:PREDICTED: multidrug resistance-associated protein 4-like [Vollenhovia emeryi]|uniref:multidrug resistance-associated protein 4-like n=1 Tax=Vollenhovia emeryi TaxID=411798 RepID=UPI0005F56C8A|nr:PREDICTED: multidrug resistance-associated protein 4-like [Vollenhovia emeryi]
MDKDTTDLKPNPRETANIFSVLFYWWLRKLFIKSSTSNLEESDIYRPIKADESEKLTDHLEKYWSRELDKLKNLDYTMSKNGQVVLLKKDVRPRLYKAIYKAFWLPYSINGIYLFIEFCVILAVIPIFQSWVISYFVTNSTTSYKTTINDAVIYISSLTILLFISVLINHHALAFSQQIGIRIRISCSSLIYKKLLRLNKASMNEIDIGQIMNLLGNDVNCFDMVMRFLNFIWIMPIQVVIITSLMWQKIGISTLVGVGLQLTIALMVQGIFSWINYKIKVKIMLLTDRRVQLISELVAGIQIMKMYVWEKPFSKIVSSIRKLEIKKIKLSSYVRGMYLAVSFVSQRLVIYITLITFVLMGNNLTASLAFEVFVYFSILRVTTSTYFPLALMNLGQSIVSLNRIEKLLLMDEVNTGHPEKTLQCKSQKLNKVTNIKNETDRYISKDKNVAPSEPQELSDLPVCVKLHRVYANWISSKLPPTLCNINMTIMPGQLCAVVGAVGSGKSSVLYLLLNELDLSAGAVILTQDSSRNSFRDKMSNGYFKSNPNLRISYASQDPWIFNGTVRDNILFGQPYDKVRYTQVTKVCALTKDFQQFPQRDMAMVGDRGISLSGGQRARVNLARAVYRQADLYLFDDPLSAVDSRVSRHLYRKCITEYLRGKTRILVTHQLQFLKRTDHIVVLDQGSVKMQGSYNTLVQSNLDFVKMLDNLSHEAQKKEEQKSSESSAKKISITRRASGLSTTSSIISDIDDSDYVETNQEEAETRTRGRISGRTYKEYLHNGGNYFTLFMLLLAFLLGQIFSSGTDYWVKVWVTLEDARRIGNTSDIKQSANIYNDSFLGSIFTLGPDGLLSTVDAIYVYTFCITVCIVIVMFRNFHFMRMCTKSSCTMHNTMFSNLLQARMSFFHHNPSGRILNRFSKDVGIVDEMLPFTTLEAIQMVFTLCAVIILEAILIQWILIPIAVLAVLLYFAAKFFMRFAQNVRRLESITKSPVLTHVNATLNGLPTIRSSGAGIETMMQKQFHKLQDRQSSTSYLYLITVSAFGFFTDSVVCLFLVIICISLILINENEAISESIAGLALSQVLAMSGLLQYGIRQISETMSLMTCVERILEYTNLPQEVQITSNSPPPSSWPSQGQLIVKNVSLKYHQDDPPVLKNLNVSIEPGWKVGVVGRTGAGKSSLISALFRLFNEYLEGEIKIDGRDTSTVSLSELRSKISIIPQQPVLFSESLRYNLDPFGQYDDMKLWDVLRQVELNDIALDHDVFSGGRNFSCGQRQLICLARVILRNNRLLVLDEATSNIDMHTDALIQDAIRNEFKECTVITVAHRLNTIIDSDRIIVMENGSIVEFGCPYELLREKPSGYFSQMLQKTGNQMAENLLGLARKACEERNDHHEWSKQTTENESKNVTITESSAL